MRRTRILAAAIAWLLLSTPALAQTQQKTTKHKHPATQQMQKMKGGNMMAHVQMGRGSVAECLMMKEILNKQGQAEMKKSND